MKKFFSYLGLVFLLMFSFIYTEKTVSVVKQFDDIMIEINEIKEQNKVNHVDAKIDGNSVIPGISGIEIDVSKSYYEMKKSNVFNANLIVYKKVLPVISVSNNKDKYIISGNKNHQNVALIFKVENVEETKKIVSILSNNDIKGNYFIKELFDIFYIDKLDDEKNIIGIINNNNYLQMDKKLKKITKKDYNFCYYKNINFLNQCAKDNNYTVKSIETGNYPLKEVKENLTSGAIISFDVNDNLIKELDVIIKYIKSKGFNMVTLDEIIKE